MCYNPLGLCTETMFLFLSFRKKTVFYYWGTHEIGARDLVAASEWCGGGFHVT